MAEGEREGERKCVCVIMKDEEWRRQMQSSEGAFPVSPFPESASECVCECMRSRCARRSLLLASFSLFPSLSRFPFLYLPHTLSVHLMMIVTLFLQQQEGSLALRPFSRAHVSLDHSLERQEREGDEAITRDGRHAAHLWRNALVGESERRTSSLPGKLPPSVAASGCGSRRRKEGER